MRKYLVKVDNDEFEVQIRLISDEGEANVEEAKVVAPVVEEKKAPVKPVDGEKVEAPLGGTIMKVNVKAGDQVKAGDLLMTLEALKLENEITAPCDGKVAEVMVKSGDSVEMGAPLLVIEKA